MRKNLLPGIGVVCFLLSRLFVPLLLTQDTQDLGTVPGVEYVVESGDEATFNWITKKVRAKGNGFGPEDVKELARRKILAKRAAQLDAYRNLLEVVQGVRVTSSTSVADMMLESDSIRAKTGGMLKGMQVVAVTYSNEGGCEVTVEVDIDQNGQFLLAALNKGEVPVKDNYPKFDWIAERGKLERAEARIASLREECRKQAVALENAHQEQAPRVERSRSGNPGKFQGKIVLAYAQNELDSAKTVVTKVLGRLQDSETEPAVKGGEGERLNQFLKEKDKELADLSAIMADYKNSTPQGLLDEEKLNGYVKQIEDLKWEISKKLVDFYKRSPPEKKDPPEEKAYTGLLVDATDVDLEPALAPSILNEEGKQIFGLGASPSQPSKGSLAKYTPGTVEWVKQKGEIGDNPLVVKCLKTHQQSNIVISNEDVRKLLLLPEIPGLLEQEKVTILTKG